MATKIVSILPAGTNSHEETAENVGAIATDFISDGVVGSVVNTSGVAPSTGAFAVNAQGTPDMTVAVTGGIAWVSGTPTGGNSQRFRVNMSSSENVTIAANSSGGTRYDFIYIKLDPDKLADPNLAADDVATLVVSRSTVSTSDDGTPPAFGYKIAVVTVTNGASSIVNANITDSRAQASMNSVLNDGWTPVTGTWTYASATTITVPAGATSKYSVGDKIKLTQSGSVKYFYIVTVASTLLTITGGSDYTLANSTISDAYYSKVQTPQGFPDQFNYTPTWTNLTIGSGTNTFSFKMIGKLVIVRVKLTLSSTTVGTNPQFSVPVNEAAFYSTASLDYVGACTLADTGTAFYQGGLTFRSANKIAVVAANASGTYSAWNDVTATAPHTWANTDVITGTAQYYVA